MKTTKPFAVVEAKTERKAWVALLLFFLQATIHHAVPTRLTMMMAVRIPAPARSPVLMVLSGARGFLSPVR
jgi:hypothetical protein